MNDKTQQRIAEYVEREMENNPPPPLTPEQRTLIAGLLR